MALLRQLWRERKVGLVLLLFIGYIKVFHTLRQPNAILSKPSFDQIVTEVEVLQKKELVKISRLAKRRIRALSEGENSGDYEQLNDLISDLSLVDDDDGSELNVDVATTAVSVENLPTSAETATAKFTDTQLVSNATAATNTTSMTNSTTTTRTINPELKIQLEKLDPLKNAFHAAARGNKPAAIRIVKPKTYVNATKLNVYVFYKPGQRDRRDIFRKYVAMWRRINPPEMIPFSYWLVTAATDQTSSENLDNDDMLLYDGFDKSHMGTDQESWEYEWRMFLGVLEHAGSTDTEFGHVTLTTRGTDIINFEWIKKCTAQLSADPPALNSTQIISIDPMRRDLKHKKNVADLKMLFRSDLIPFWLNKLVTIDFNAAALAKPFEKFFAISGIGRPAEINRIQSNGINEAIITIPWEYEGFSERYNVSTFEAWTMEKKPSTEMSYNLPARYLEEREEPWQTEMTTVPACNTTGILAIVKTARANFINRILIRMYYKWTTTPVLLRFVIGTGNTLEKPEIAQNITSEVEEYNDIVVGNFIDQYDNLPLKTLTGHQYANEVCNQTQVRYNVFHDDDSLPIYNRFDTFLAENRTTNVSCFAHRGEFSRPMRWNKYNVTFEQWEAGHYFPQFCGGPCTGFTAGATSGILDAAKKTDAKGFKLEDVLFTGVMRTKADLPTPEFHAQICKHLPTNTLQGLVNTIQSSAVNSADKDIQTARRQELVAVCKKHKLQSPMSMLPIASHFKVPGHQ